jgi:hypothetical protein
MPSVFLAFSFADRNDPPQWRIGVVRRGNSLESQGVLR